MKTEKLPKDAKYIGAGFGWRNRSVYWSPSEKKYFVSMTLPAVEKGYDVFRSLPTVVIPRGFHIRPVAPETARKMILGEVL